jgi:membrane protein required for colicin V production
MTPLDIGLLVVMLISGILAMVRGFMREILSIAAWLIAAVVTLYGFSRAEFYVKQYITNEIVAKGVAIGSLFLITLLVVSLFTVKISDLILDSRVGALDRSLGFLFGLGRGLIIMVVAFLFFAWLVPEKSQPDWIKGARSLPVLQGIGSGLYSFVEQFDAEGTLLKIMRPRREGDEPADPTMPQIPAPAPQQKSGRAAPSRLAAEGETGYKRADRQGFEQLLESTRGAPR